MEHRLCAHCGNPDLLDYGVNDECWETVVPADLQPKIVCLICFDSFAKVAGEIWTHEIDYVKFDGAAGSFVWYP